MITWQRLVAPFRWHALAPDPDWAVNRVLQIEGQMSREEVAALIHLAQGVPASQVMVEIGAYRGRSAVALGLGSRLGNEARIYSIDPHDCFVGVLGGTYGPLDLVCYYKNLTDDLTRRQAESIDQIADVGFRWKAQNVGLLFIDGNHQFRAVLDDFNAWLPCVVPGGIIAFHDANIPDVQSVLGLPEVKEKIELLEQIHTLAINRRRV
jgi:predicted O-methyltransferase YrrM